MPFILTALLKISIIDQEYIQKVNPYISEIHSIQIALSINKFAKEYDLNKELLLAIIKTESTFDITRVSRTKDYGLMQLNYKTIEALRFDIKRIRTDVDYSIGCGVLYLVMLRERYPNDKYWWARYHSSTPKYKQIYISKIKKVIRGAI
jgi:soluble lytic murein transglycosylase-like protein